MEQQESINAKKQLNRICFAIFGLVTFGYMGKDFNIPGAIAGAVLGYIFGIFTFGIMMGIVKSSNGTLKQQYGKGFAANAVSRGMLFMIPYAVLCLSAAFFLHWTAAILFVSAALMSSAASIGAELSRLGKTRLANMLLPSLTAFLLSGLWMIAVTPVGSLLGTLEKLIVR